MNRFSIADNCGLYAARRLGEGVRASMVSFQNTIMEHNNFFTITIPKGRRVNFKMLAKVYGSLQTYDYSNPAVSATCRVYLIWGKN